jgi:putative holliday junction resolvase
VSRAVAVDLGQRRIGVAVSDDAGMMAFPRPFVERRGDWVGAIAAVVADVDAAVVVVGLPLSLDGSEGPAARAARVAAGELAAALPVPVETFDERLTTVSAGAALTDAGRRGSDHRRSVDSAAATVLLQAWLERR